MLILTNRNIFKNTVDNLERKGDLGSFFQNLSPNIEEWGQIPNFGRKKLNLSKKYCINYINFWNSDNENPLKITVYCIF